MEFKKIFLMFALPSILIISFVLRLYYLGDVQIWLDEGQSIWISSLNDFSQIVKELVICGQQPLHYILLHFWIIFFGKSEFSIRFISVIFGVLSVLMSYKIGKLIFDKSVGILCAFLIAISTCHINYSQEARPYMLTLFLSLLSIYFFIKLLEEKNLKLFTCLIVTNTLLIYNHYSGIPIIVTENIYFLTLYFSKQTLNLSIRTWITIQSIILLLFTPWAIAITTFYKEKTASLFFWSHHITLTDTMNAFISFAGSEITLLIYIILIFLNKKTLNTKKNSYYLLFLWLLMPFASLFILTTPIYHERYIIIAIIPFYLLVSKGLTNINAAIREIILTIIVISSLNNFYHYYSVEKKYQWKEVVSYIEEQATSKDLILFNAAKCKKYNFDYYSKRNDLTKVGFPFNPYDEELLVDINNIQDLKKLIDDYKTVWVIKSHSYDPNNLMEKTLFETFNLQDQKYYRGISVMLFSKKSSAPQS